MSHGFLFATGVENSIPTVGNRRVDQMEASGHYRRWKDDFDATEYVGCHALRYGPPLHTTWLGVGHYDWSFADETFADLRRRKLNVIVDLCHFGLPDWLGNFQNGEWPELFARYARDFAARFPWVQLYTPVNEMFICAQFSARFGWWNERMKCETAFVTALKHLVRANVLAMEAILEVRPDALFIQSESTEHFHPESPDALHHADHLNRLRFLSLDLNYGHRVDSQMYEYLMDNGMTRGEYAFFMRRSPARRHCVMGTDYYVTNEHRVHADGLTCASGDIYGYAEITRQYHERYRIPVMHTETNLNDGPCGTKSVEWLHKQWANLLRLRQIGVPVLGFTWYSITDQVDWDTALRENNGNVNPLGLFDLDRNIRPVGKAYKQLSQDWHKVLQHQRDGLVLPIEMPLAA
jgi:beta-glucosidase/6-phospho-beta-glucosidase/beta-galactosidase